MRLHKDYIMLYQKRFCFTLRRNRGAYKGHLTVNHQPSAHNSAPGEAASFELVYNDGIFCLF